MKKQYDLLIFFISLLLVFLLLLIPNKTEKKEKEHQNNLYASYLAINKEINSSFKLINENLLSNNIKNLVYYNESNNEYASYLIDMTTGKLCDLYSLIIPEYINDFNEKELELLNLKYPLFIVNGIKMSENVKRKVIIYPNQMKIYYKNVITSPMYNDEISLVINYNEISKFLNYDFDLDDEYANESAYDYDPTKKYIAFSFDDGPSQANTVDIVNYLKNNKSHATFFELGQLMMRYPDIVKYVLENGNEIGSHTYTHKNMAKTNIKTIEEELKNTENALNSIAGQTIELMRPPYGSINNKVKEAFNYAYILWSVDTNDWKYKDQDRLYDFVVNNVNDGDIVLMHDIHLTTKQGVERILPELYVRGYRVVSVSELARIKGINLESKTIYRSFKK